MPVAQERTGITFSEFKHLRKIDEANTEPGRLKWLWDQLVSKCDYIFTDETRGDEAFFISQFLDQNVEFFEAGNGGLFVVENAHANSSCRVHYMFWDNTVSSQQRKIYAMELFDYLFASKKVHRCTGLIPAFNQHAIRFALTMGMKYEGEIREEFCSRGKFINVLIYGLLEKDYRERRGRLL